MLTVNFYNENDDRVHTRVLWYGHGGDTNYLFHSDEMMITNAHDILKEWGDTSLITGDNQPNKIYEMDRQEFMDRAYLR